MQNSILLFLKKRQAVLHLMSQYTTSTSSFPMPLVLSEQWKVKATLDGGHRCWD